MNFKKTWNRSEGFTLVELIVVIAILAILAGVAVPAYSGYIKKAEKAADLQLLGAVNTAFAAAALENGDDVSVDVTSAAMPLTGTEGAMKVNADGIQPAAYQAAFKRYFAGNTDSVFKVISGLNWSNEVKAFVDAGDNMVTVNYGGINLSVPKDYIDSINNSGFMTYEGLGSDVLLGKLESVTDLAAGLTSGSGGQLLANVFGSADFQKYAAQSVGLDISGMTTSDEINAALGTKMNEILGADATQADKNAFLANAAVLYASKEAASMNTDDVISVLTTGNPKDTIIGNIGTNTSTSLAQAALAYGMYTSFAYSEYGSTEAQGKDELGAMNDLSNPKFQEYLKSDAGKADLEGYMAALNVINSSTNDPDAVGKLLTEGFGGDDLKDALSGVLGNN